MRRGSAGPKEPASGDDGNVDHSGASPGYCENALSSASERRRQRRKTSQYISRHQAMNLSDVDEQGVDLDDAARKGPTPTFRAVVSVE
jgi:hypothetical protein